ncbi:redoxin domain-containing protein [Mesobacillus harenae]|uniref:redoxin domain-containing protein n=1 Tax=Mesobacillus harenae TaxID=2213203 RepID=UPI00157FBE75|nr:redoxin domain-containing protein [Mesobacillus harenae]
MFRKMIAPVFLLLLFSVAIVQAMEESDQNAVIASKPISAAVGEEAPDFTLKDLKGKEVTLSEFKGKKVMINFWATWCPPCKAEMPAMQELYSKTGGELEIIAVNLDSKNNVAGFADENELTFPILLDEQDSVNQVYSVISIPTSYFLNEQGIIIAKHIGSMTYEQLEEYVNKIK